MTVLTEPVCVTAILDTAAEPATAVSIVVIRLRIGLGADSFYIL